MPRGAPVADTSLKRSVQKGEPVTHSTHPIRLLLVLVALCGTITGADAQNPTAPGTIVTVAGTGSAGFSADGVRALEARLDSPAGLALDARGTLYFADTFNYRVRKINPDGTLATVAGGNGPGFSGDGGAARAAKLSDPTFMTVDGAGNLLFSDVGNHRVRNVAPDGTISTVAGTGTGGYKGDGGPATQARLNGPAGLAVDAEGNRFIAELFNQRVRKIDPAGVITTVAGGGTKKAGEADGGPATEARLGRVADVAVDTAGNLYLVDYDNHQVRKVDRQGKISTVAGTGLPGFSGDGGPATQARLTRPLQVAVDSAGNLFIADWGNYRVRKVAPDGTISTIAGNGTRRYTGDGGQATATGLRGPSELVIDADGNLYLANSAVYLEDGLTDTNERILKIFGVAAPGLLAGRPFPSP
jgi:sugar lactone lactonase YvrE